MAVSTVLTGDFAKITGIDKLSSELDVDVVLSNGTECRARVVLPPCELEHVTIRLDGKNVRADDQVAIDNLSQALTQMAQRFQEIEAERDAAMKELARLQGWAVFLDALTQSWDKGHESALLAIIPSTRDQPINKRQVVAAMMAGEEPPRPGGPVPNWYAYR